MACRQDTTPSILECPIDPPSHEGRPPKRTKLSEAPGPITIASQIQSGTYENIEELLADVDTAASKIISEVQGGIPNGAEAPTSINKHLQHTTRASAFKKELRNIVLREALQRPQNIGISLTANSSSAEESLEKQSESKKSGTVLSHDSSSRTVLTLYGSAPNPKQLFSSLQEPRLTENEESAPHDGIFKEPSSTILPSLRESALPNGISTTKVIPVHSMDSSDDKQHVPTLGDLFAPPISIAALNPPRQSRHTATRSSSVNWFNPTEAATPVRPHRRESYTVQPVSTGQWLTYNVAPSPTQLSSPEAKRKQRDRALSIGESKPSLPQEVVAAHQQAKEDALFRSVYSSFAPTRDDAAALVPEQVKNRLWWNRVGDRKFQEAINVASLVEAEEEAENFSIVQADKEMSEEERFKEAVESWQPEDIPPEFKVTDVGDDNGAERDIEGVMKEISELLETLNSYQRVRNLSLATNSRTSAGQNPQLAAMSGSPTSPSSAEFDVYSMLKSQLSLMIAALPPYAVAKLNGDQLEALSISTRIPIEGKNYKGTMEEDEFTARTKQTALSAAAGSSVRTATPGVGLSTRTGHYQPPTVTPAQRSGYVPQSTVPRPPAPAATYPTQQYSSRPTPATNHYTPTSSHPSYTTQRPPSSSSHRNSLSSQQYGQQTPQLNQYSNGNRQYPTQNGYSYSQQYSASQQAGSPGPIQASQLQRPSQPGYQQRAQNSQGYGYGSAPPGRSASPQNTTTSYTPQHQQRASYTTPVGAAPSAQRPQYYQQASSVGAANLNALQLNGATGTVGQHLGLTADEQAMLMNRQKAQLAQQIQMNNMRQGSGTPQPPSAPLGGQTNGTPVAQSNGLIAGQGH